MLGPNQLVELLLPMLILKLKYKSSQGLPTARGAKGHVVFSSAEAVEWASKGDSNLVREETSPEDVDGMHKSRLF